MRFPNKEIVEKVRREYPAGTAKQMICRFVRLKATFVLTLDKSFGTGTYAKRKPPFCGEKPRVSFNVR